MYCLIYLFVLFLGLESQMMTKYLFVLAVWFSLIVWCDSVKKKILTVVMTSYYENVRSCTRHTVVRRVLFWAIRFALSWPRDSLSWILIGQDLGQCGRNLCTKFPGVANAHAKLDLGILIDFKTYFCIISLSIYGLIMIFDWISQKGVRESRHRYINPWSL